MPEVKPFKPGDLVKCRCHGDCDEVLIIKSEAPGGFLVTHLDRIKQALHGDFTAPAAVLEHTTIAVGGTS